MVKEVRFHFEGNKALRPGFHKFLSEIVEKARAQRTRFQLVACGANAAQDHPTALKMHPEAWDILLRDSEGPDVSRPPRESEFWMIQLMEAWFLADPDALKAYYGNDFNTATLKSNPNVEQILKEDVLSGLKHATKSTQKSPYHKTKHAPAILERIDPQKAQRAAPNCERLFREVLGKLDEPPHGR